MCSRPNECWKHGECYCIWQPQADKKRDTVANIWSGAMADCMGNQALLSISDWFPLLHHNSPQTSSLPEDSTGLWSYRPLGEVASRNWSLWLVNWTQTRHKTFQRWLHVLSAAENITKVGTINQVGHVTHTDSETETDPGEPFTSLSGTGMGIFPESTPTIKSLPLSSSKHIKAVTMMLYFRTLIDSCMSRLKKMTLPWK